MEKVLMKTENRWLSAVKHPKRTLHRIFLRFYRLTSNRSYITAWFKDSIGYKPDFDNPKTFNEKLNWLKLYDHNPLYHTLVDKYEVKSHVTNIVGDKYVVPCYGVWDSFDEIEFDKLPQSFVLKPTNWGCPMIVKDKSTFDYAAAKKYFDGCKKFDIYSGTREWGYMGVKPRILADKFLDDHSVNNQLQDYKWWCFNGDPQIMYFTIKSNEAYENFYDMDFKPVMIDHGFPRFQPEFEKPECFEEMKELASKLSKGIPFVRMDFFYVNGQVYFGEYTMYDWGGGQPFGTYEQDLELGKLIDLSRVIKAKD